MTALKYWDGAQWATLALGNGAGGGGPAVAARAYRSTAFTPPAGTWTKIPLDTASFDSGGLLDLANGRIVIPSDGYYNAQGHAMTTMSATGTYSNWAVGIARNGTRFAITNSTLAVQTGRADVATDTVYCNAGDIIELHVYNAQGTALGPLSPGQNYLSVSKISGVGPPGPTGPAGPGAATVAARIIRTATTALTAGTLAKIPLDTAQWDTNGGFQAANSRYICPVTGYYAVRGLVSVNRGGTNAVNTIYPAIYKNGTMWSRGNLSPSGDPLGLVQVGVSDLVNCNAGDFLELWCYGTSAWGVFGGPEFTWMSVALVSGGPPGPRGPEGPIGPPRFTVVVSALPYTIKPNEYLIASGTGTLTVPAMPNGDQIGVWASVSGAVTVVPPAGWTFFYGGGWSSSVSIPALGSARWVSEGSFRFYPL